MATDVSHPSLYSSSSTSTNKEEPCYYTHKEEQKHEGTNKVVENDNHFNGCSAAAGLASVTDFVETATAKCHHCTWTKQFGSLSNVLLENVNGYSDLLMKVKTRIQHGPCLVCETKGNGIDSARSVLPYESSEKEYHLTEEIDQQLKEFDVEAVLAKQETHDLFCPNCKSCITKRVILRKRKRKIPSLDTKAKRDKSHTELVDGSVHETNQGDHAIAASDVGTLVPPSDNDEPEREPEVFRCLSCFSFFIPLSKLIDELFTDLSCLYANHVCVLKDLVTLAGNGFKLFPSFRSTREPETLQNASLVPASNVENPSIITASNANWFFALFTSNKGENTLGQGDASIENSRTGAAEQPQSSSFTNEITSSAIGNPESPPANTTISMNVKLRPDTKPGHGGVLNSPIPPKVKSVKIESLIENSSKSSVALHNEALVVQNDLSSDVINGLRKGGRDFIDLPANEQLLPEREKSHDSVDVIKTDTLADMPKRESVPLAIVAKTEIHFNAGKPAKDAILKSHEGSPNFQKDVDKTPEIALDSFPSLKKEAQAQAPAQSFDSAVVANGVASVKQSSVVNATIPSDHDFKKEEINPSVPKEKKEALKSSISQIADDVPVEGAIVAETHTQIYIGEQPRAEIAEPQEWEILKSIVYGGLIESITSLGVVSSAASSGAAPLNIIALGLANLISGLFVIGHNLIELRKDNSGGDSQQMNMQEDRYQEQLGSRANFVLHAFLVVLSFIIFGSVPLVVYGLLIQKNYSDEVKIAVVAATCVVCIIVLAFGKVYTRRPPKSYAKTVLQYVAMALATSGISYIAGDLVKDLLDKFNSHSNLVLTMPLPSTRMEPALKHIF
ncbi:hypothetical protein RJT34_00962 [Clitoria ternatea]|uniref:Membrane protein of ER body-like protein n=1 Tax=Clitoria ternatea TaxID=43366 RepID=A0AAN9KFS9_CLITE